LTYEFLETKENTMNTKPKWSVELHGPCPHPESFDVIPASAPIDPPGASESAYLIGTLVATTDANVDLPPVSFEADPRYGTLPSWLSLSEEAIDLADAAGTCAYSFRVRASMDFTGTTPPTSGGVILIGATAVVDSAAQGFFSVSAPGDGTDSQTVGDVRLGGVVSTPHLGVKVGLSATLDPDAIEVVVDGSATISYAMVVTRLSPAALLD
jgi:hypothetical protein